MIHKPVISFVFSILFLFSGFCCTKATEYKLHTKSEDYNTKYFFCYDISPRHQVDTMFSVKPEFPDGFVVEMSAIKVGEKIEFIYNDNQCLQICNKGKRLKVGKKKIRLSNNDKDYSKLSLYFVNQKMAVYIDDILKYECGFRIDRKKQIGIKSIKKDPEAGGFIYCYEPVPFNQVDYGELLEEGQLIRDKEIRMYPHNVGQPYNLTFPKDIVKQSKRSIKFEYRQVDSQNQEASRMQRARSELSGVYCHSPQNKWIIEYDFLIPQETRDDAASVDIITQLHESSTMSTTPPFSMSLLEGWLCCTISGDKQRIETWGSKKRPSDNYTKRILYLQKGRWYHIKLFIKESWRRDNVPYTGVWIDDELVFESYEPNCYFYEPRVENNYNYLKFGVYKSGWLMTDKIQPEVSVRTYYFDNFIVKY